MDVLHQSLVLVHLVAFAALLGGALVQLRTLDPEINTAMLHGSWVGLLSGAALWVLDGRAGDPPAVAPAVVTTVVALFVTILVVRNRRYLTIPRGLLVLITVLVLVQTAVSVFWV